MRRLPPPGSAACLLLVVLGAGAAAQSPPQIDGVRIGLPAGEGGASRNGAWTPLAITLRGGSGGNPQGAYRLRIETTDLEEIAYQVHVAVPALSGDSLREVQGYVVPGGDGAGFRVHLETGDGKPVHATARLTRANSRDLIVGRDDVLFFAAGAGLPGLRRAVERLDRPDGKAAVSDDGPRRHVAHAEDVSRLPDHWTGYDAVDVVVLTTGKRDFVLQMTADAAASRRAALLEWVRRGGQLVLSVGRNHQEVAALLARWPLIGCGVTGSETVRSLPIVSTQWCNRVGKPPLAQVEVATLVPGGDVNVLVREERRPVIVQAACGPGRVVLVGLDLDASPFSAWDGQDAFWARLQAEVAPQPPGRVGRKPAEGGKADVGVGGSAPKYDLEAELQRGLETFEDVPVLSFGWVALFILFYLVLVGPLDYFVLKRLFKRLELTWITFPLTVIVVSVAAYAVAYHVKGTDLRINQIDLIDVDLHPGPGGVPPQVHGSAWFTLFSPRVASYTVGIEPDRRAWTAAPPEGAPGPTVTLLEAGERVLRAGSQGLFKRPYEVADDASGLRRVPIPVWATRSFTADWRAPAPPGSPVVGIHDDVGPVRMARDGSGLVGRLTNHLPVRLQDVTLFYRGRAYSLDRLEPGEWKRLEPLFAAEARGQNRDPGPWFADQTLAPGLPLAPSGRPINAAFLQGRSAFQLMKPLLFFRAAERGGSSNAGLRRLDQSWRLRELPQYPAPERTPYRDEAILVARVPMLADTFPVAASDPSAPTRLWLGRLPGEGDWPPTAGFLTRETYLRVFLPVQRDR